MRLAEPYRTATQTIYLVPVHGKRCAAICHSQPGLKLRELLIEGSQVREIFRQRMIRRDRILWILYLDTDGMRVGAEAQLSFVDSIYVFLSAAECILKSALCDSLEFHVWGDVSGQPRDEQDRIETALKSTAQNLTYHGPYDNAETTALMGEVDYVVVPSVWWENAPLVIQEAFLSGRPVIASNIGGMQEKVQDGENGLHFEVGNSRDLAKKLELAITPCVRETLRRGALAARARMVTTLDYVRLYEGLASMQRRRDREARRREMRPVSVEVSA